MSHMALLICIVLLTASGLAADVPFVFGEGSRDIAGFTSAQLEQASSSSPDLAGVPPVTTPSDNEVIAFPVTGGGNALESTTEKNVMELKRVFDERVDVNNSDVLNKGAILAAKFPGDLTVDQVSSIYGYIKNGDGTKRGWSYVRDRRGLDYYRYANESLKIGEKADCSGIGDCDDFAILMSALIESIGGTTRIILARNSSIGGHAYTEVYLGNLSEQNNQVDGIINWLKQKFNTDKIYTHIDTDTKDVWLNLDWGQDEKRNTHPGGPFYQGDKHIVLCIRDRYEKTALKLSEPLQEEAKQGVITPPENQTTVFEPSQDGEKQSTIVPPVTATLLGSGTSADIPCGYNETGFHEITAPGITPGQVQTVTLSAPSQDQGSPLTGVPRLSEPGNEVKSNIDLIKDAVDPQNARNRAVEIASDAPGPFNIEQICYIYKFLRDNWEYVSDPRGIDYISSGSNTIALSEAIAARQNRSVAGAGDGDDYAILIASLLDAIGGNTRVVLAYGGGTGHAYTEVYLGDVDSNTTKGILNWLRSKYNCDLVYGHLTEENKAFWLNLDWNSTHPGGPLYKSPKQSVAYVRQNYPKTVVGLPPQYVPLKGGMLACKVSDEYGNPLASTVMVTGGGMLFPISIDLSGGFIQKLPTGDYTVTASKSGYKFDTKVVTVLEGLEASVDLIGTRENAPYI